MPDKINIDNKYHPSKNYILRGKNALIRSVRIDDAEFILSLRTDKTLTQYLHQVDDDIDKQILFIKNDTKKNYYFISEDLSGNRYGTIRVTNIRENSFTISSWLTGKNAPMGLSVTAMLLSYDFGFFNLNKGYNFFNVRKNNISVANFHKIFGDTIIDEDEQNYYYILHKSEYIKIRDKYKQFL
ncbi:MAG: hypothetical protein ACR2NY_06465 [Alphaproteobacteria bacterium]